MESKANRRFRWFGLSRGLSRRNRSVIASILCKVALMFVIAIALTLLCVVSRHHKTVTHSVVSNSAEPITPEITQTVVDPTSTKPGTAIIAPKQVLTKRFRSKQVSPHPPSGKACYKTDHIDPERIQMFSDVLAGEQLPTNGSNIFFHETTCLNGAAQLNVRQACAIESAARANPNTNVFLLYASPVGFERGQPRPSAFEALAAYRNVHWRNLDLWTYTLDTPAFDWIRTDDLFQSRYLSVHMADFLRLVSLFKWGGTHMDLDFVVRKSFERLPPTYAAEEIDGYIANGLINFDYRGLGHFVAEYILNEFVSSYNNKIFGANGPALIKRVLHDLCNSENLLDCPLITIYPKETFYAVYATRWRRLFDKSHAVESMAKFSGSMAVHMWNALSSRTLVKVGERSAYELLAREFCPKVFATVEGGYF